MDHTVRNKQEDDRAATETTAVVSCQRCLSRAPTSDADIRQQSDDGPCEVCRRLRTLSVMVAPLHRRDGHGEVSPYIFVFSNGLFNSVSSLLNLILSRATNFTVVGKAPQLHTTVESPPRRPSVRPLAPPPHLTPSSFLLVRSALMEWNR